MKLILYFVIYLITIGLIVKPVKKKYSYIFFLWVVILLSLCYTIQSTVGDPDSDLEKYVGIFESNLFLWNPNFLREFLFWGFARLIYYIFEDRNITFLIINLFFSFMILKGFKNYKSSSNNLYLLFGFLLFFPFLSGMHVIYRQLISMSIVFFSLSCFYNKRNSLGVFTFIISFLFHNISLIFLPLILFSYKKFYKFFIMSIAMLIMPILFSSFESSKNEFLTRSDINYLPTLSIAYLVVFILLIFIILIINYHNLIKADHFNNLIIITSLIYIISFFSLNSNLTIERIGMYSMGIIYFYIGFYLDKFNGKTYVKLIYFHISLIPLITFYSSYLS